MCIGEIECVLERECVRERVCVICKRILGKTRKSVDLGEREREKERVLARECYLQKSIIRTERERERKSLGSDIKFLPLLQQSADSERQALTK